MWNIAIAFHPNERNNFWIIAGVPCSIKSGVVLPLSVCLLAKTGGSRGLGHECEKLNIEGKCVEGCYRARKRSVFRGSIENEGSCSQEDVGVG